MLADKLRAKQAEYANGAKKYDQPSLPEVLAYNKQYRAENPTEYGYNSAIVAFILAHENIPSELVDCLETQVYLSQHDIDNEKKNEQAQKMEAEGWTKLTPEVLAEADKQGKLVQVSAKQSLDWLSVKIDKTYKPHKLEDRGWVLMKPRARTRFYYLTQFENAFCKIV